MSNPNEPERPDDDLDAWIEEMSGRRPPSTTATRVLREVIQRDTAAEIKRQLGDAASPEADQRAVDRLRESLRKARAARGAVPQAGPTPDVPPIVRPPGGVASNQWRWRMVASLGVLAFVVGTVWQLRPQDDGDFTIADSGATVWRDVAEPPRFVVVQPERAAQMLAKEVAPFDAKPSLYREKDTVFVDFSVQPGKADALTAGISDTRIRPAIRLGANRIIFVKPPG